jgi:putative membrane protein
MKGVIFFGLVLALTVFVPGGYAQGTMNSSDNKTQMSGKKSPDSKFMMMAATSDMNEIGLSNQALSKSTNEDVKKLAQMMVDDHTKASEELKPIAMSKNVMLPTEMDSKHKSAMEKMSGMSGSQFDMAYVKMMIKDHEKAVSMFQKEANNGKDAEAKAFAAKTLPVLQMHLDMSRTTMSNMMNNNKTASHKMSGM